MCTADSHFHTVVFDRRLHYFFIVHSVSVSSDTITLPLAVMSSGNIYFCWLSIHESVIWAMVGPVFVLVTATLVNLVMAIRASLSLKDHVEGFGNLRSVEHG